MKKGIIYYSDFHVAPAIQWICLQQLKSATKDMEVVSVTLNQPLDFGKNFVLEGERSNTMYNKQILKALEESTADYVFFTEHDVLYAPEHFDFTPPKDDTFYYDLAILRWDYPKDRLIGYDNLTSLSMMCCNRKLALNYYTKKLDRIIKSGWDKEDGIGNMQPIWMRALGYEPGTKRRRIGGFSDDVSGRWTSKNPNVDIRHGKTLSNPKVHQSQFKHQPTGWLEKTFKDVKNFNLSLIASSTADSDVRP